MTEKRRWHTFTSVMKIHELFASGLRRRELRNASVARLLGTHRSYISHLLAGRCTPSLKVAAAIERLTQDWADPILAVEWVTPAPSEAAEAGAGASEAHASDPEGDSSSEPAAA